MLPVAPCKKQTRQSPSIFYDQVQSAFEQKDNKPFPKMNSALQQYPTLYPLQSLLSHLKRIMVRSLSES